MGWVTVDEGDDEAGHHARFERLFRAIGWSWTLPMKVPRRRWRIVSVSPTNQTEIVVAEGPDGDQLRSEFTLRIAHHRPSSEELKIWQVGPWSTHRHSRPR
ncbi:MAG: hypothetical protein AB7V43_23270 [Acidimicrobiia bacterium]